MNKKVLIIIIAAVVVVGAAAFVFLSGMLGGGDAEEPVDKVPELSYYIPSAEGFVSNLVDSRMLLKANMSLGFDKSNADANVLKERASEMCDIINRELRTLNEEDLTDPAILDILNERLVAALRDGGFEDVYDIKFTAFVAQ